MGKHDSGKSREKADKDTAKKIGADKKTQKEVKQESKKQQDRHHKYGRKH